MTPKDTPVIRGKVKKATAKKGRLARFDAEGRAGEEFSDREIMQQYGYSSCPPEGAECLLVRRGQNIYMIASDDRRYRISLEEGEVAIYDESQNVIHLQKGGKILIESTAAVTVKSQKAVIDAGSVYLGNEQLAELGGGVVTMMCSCAMSGSPHPVNSSTVKAAL